MSQASVERQSMTMAPRSWRAALVLLVFGPTGAFAADQCTVSDLAIGVWDGPAEYMGGGPVAFATPQVKVAVKIVKPPVTTGSAASPGDSTTAGGAVPMPGIKPAPKPPRPVPKNDQERLFTAVYEGDLPEVRRLRVRDPGAAVDVRPVAAAIIRLASGTLAAGFRSDDPCATRCRRGRGRRARSDAPGVCPGRAAFYTAIRWRYAHCTPAARSRRPTRRRDSRRVASCCRGREWAR
jgi:hypothetical protein